jgi:hypothetical protein
VRSSFDQLLQREQNANRGGKHRAYFDRQPLLQQRKIGLRCNLLLKGFGQRLGNALGLLLIEVRSLAQLAGKFQRVERSAGRRLSPLLRQKSPLDVQPHGQLPRDLETAVCAPWEGTQ